MAIYKDPLLTGSHMATQQYQSNAATPNEEDANAGLFRDIREAFGAQPRGINALGAGFVRGLEHGATISSIQNRKKDLEKYNKVMDYFQEVGNEAIERNQQEEKIQYAKKSTLPQAIEYLRNISKYDSISKKEAMQLMASNFGRMIGKDIKIDAVADGDPTSATASIDGQSSFFSLYDIFPEEIIQAEAAKSMPSYQLEQQRARQQQAFENNIRQQQLDINRQNSLANQLRAENSGKSKKEEGLTTEQQEKKTYERLYELLQQGDPTTSAIPGVNWSRRVASSIPVIGDLASSGLAPQQEYKELVSDLKGQKFKKHGYRNEAEFENIKTLTSDLPREEALKFVENKLKELGVNIDHLNISEFAPGNDKVLIKLPNGAFGTMSKEEYDAKNAR